MRGGFGRRFIADADGQIGSLFDWLTEGEVDFTWSESDPEALRSSQASQDFMTEAYPDIGAVIMGRNTFDQTNGWDGVPAAGDHVFVVTHEAPTDWEHAGTAPFTFVPVVFGGGRPFFGAMEPGEVRLANPSRVAQGNRVTHLLYDVER